MLGVGLFYPRAVNEMRMLAQAVNQAKSDDSKAIAGQLEGMKGEGFDGGEIFMRKDDHQLFQDMFISSFGPLDPGAKFDEEGTGWGWKTVGVAASGAEFGTPSVISKTRCDSPVCLMPVFAAEIRKKRAARMRGYPQWRWHLERGCLSRKRDRC